MWCHWCRKANHDDAQCFSTRPADWRPKPEDAEPVPRDRSVARVRYEMYDVTVQLVPKPLAWASFLKYLGR